MGALHNACQRHQPGCQAGRWPGLGGCALYTHPDADRRRSHAAGTRLCTRGREACLLPDSDSGPALLQNRRPHVLSLWWRAAYWYGFFAQFTLLPFHQVRQRSPARAAASKSELRAAAWQEFADSGHFTWADRAKTSVRNNLLFYAVLAVGLLPSSLTCIARMLMLRYLLQGVGATGLLLLLITGELAASNVVGFCIAFSNAFGLIAGKQHPAEPTAVQYVC